MTQSEKIALFKKLYALHCRAHQFLDTIPPSINSAFFDNEAIESYSLMNDELIEAVYGKDAESVYWFLYEWKRGYTVESNGKKWIIDSIDEYIDWIIENEAFGAD